MQSLERVELSNQGKGLLLDIDVLEKYRTRGEIFRFRTREELELDVTAMTSLQAAMEILAHIETVIGGGVG